MHMKDGDNGDINSFKCIDEVYSLLTQAKCKEILTEVPRGPKNNVYYLTANSANVACQMQGRRCNFWDECRAWQSGGPVCKRVFVQQDGKLKAVTFPNGEYCIRKVIYGKRTLVPITEQPATSTLITIYQRYVHHTCTSAFRKQLSWTECAITGLVRVHRPVEYVHSKPETIAQIRATVIDAHCKPREVYAKMTVAAEDSFDKPHDHKQVRDVALTSKLASSSTPANAANELQVHVGGIHEHPFVKEISICQGRSPEYVTYTHHQIADIKRFTSKVTTGHL